MKILSWIFGALIVFTHPSLFGEGKSYADHFQGFDINLGVGYSNVVLISSRGGIKPSSHTNYGSGGGAVQLKLAKSCTFCGRGLIGLEAYCQYNSAETENRFFETVASPSETNRTFQMKGNLGLDLLLGLSTCCSNRIFIYGGPDWGHYDFHYVTPGVNSRYQHFKIGGAFGAGIEQAIGKCWTLRTTFDYRWYPSKTLNYSNGEQQTIKARLGTALFMLGYMF